MQLSITQNSFELEGKCLELMQPEKISGLIVEGTKSALPNPYIRHYQNLIHQDLSIVGFDNQNIKLDDDCYLTSVQHPRRKPGETAANLVCDMIEQGYNVAPAEPIIMPSTIVARNSIIRLDYK